MRPHAKAPNGVFCDNLILYGFPETGAIASKGFWILPPDVRGASFARLNAFQDQIRALLALVGSGRRLQVQWSCDADYRQELLAYHAVTQKVSQPEVRRVRNERFTRYWDRMQNRTLRRERLALFLSIEITRYSGNLQTATGLRDHYAAVMDELQSQFNEFAQTLRTIFHGEATVTPMDDEAHCAMVRNFLNPSLAESPQPAVAQIDPKLTIQEQCWLGEGVGQSDGGLYLDGHYHAILTLDRWPQRTHPGIITHLTGLPFLDYQITVNLTPSPTKGEIHREEKAIERLSGEYADQRRHSLAVALRKKEQKVENLASGFVRPFEVCYLIRIWAKSHEALREKVTAMQAAIHAMDGAQYFESTVPTSAQKLFFASWPGWTHSSYHYRHRYAEDNYLADIHALQQQGQVKTVAQPRLRALNNQTAFIKVGEDRPFFRLQQSTTFQQGGTATPVNQTQESFSVSTITIGTILAVTPQIDANGVITLDLLPAITRLQSIVTSPDGRQTAPVTEVKQASTIVRLRDGETAVIGGLISEDEGDSTRAVPLLGKIPLLGRAFRSQASRHSRTELVIFITAKLIP